MWVMLAGSRHAVLYAHVLLVACQTIYVVAEQSNKLAGVPEKQCSF